jgi:sodium/hydrogen exchanger 8
LESWEEISRKMTTNAAHEFEALNTLLFALLLGLCIMAAYLIRQNSLHYVPESAAAIFVGLVVSALASVAYPSYEELKFLTFEPEMFFFFLLPPITFEAGYSLKKRDFFSNFFTISLFAVFGTLVSTFVIGYLIYATGVLGLVHINVSSPLEALIFGSLISSVDPVATLSIMGNPEINCDPLLYSLVLGESVLNDAIAIVLFKAFMNCYDSAVEFSSSTIGTVLYDFTVVSLGSCVLGISIGLLCAYVYKNSMIRKYPEYEMGLLILFSYGGYALAEASELSGIMSLFCCGIVLSHYNNHNLSQTGLTTAHTVFKSCAMLAEFFVYLFIGMSIFAKQFLHWNLFFVVICIVVCAIARMVHVFPLSFIANLFRPKPIPLRMQTVIWYAGLRGAISFALVCIRIDPSIICLFRSV